jgi:GNAT superfamily N-acetyltransferase
MGRRIEPVTSDNVADLPEPCRGCIFWELGPGHSRAGDPLCKARWIERMSLEWGTCGLLAYVDDTPAGFLLYAPPAYVPRAVAFPTAPVSSDAVLLTALRVLPEHAGAGLGRTLVQAAAKDLVKRGVRAIEAYGSSEESCVLPRAFLESVGFVTCRNHVLTPRLRLDLRSAVSWREDVEGALGRLVGVVRPYPAGVREV